MKTKIRIIAVAFLLSLSPLGARMEAHDFTLTKDGQRLCFRITDAKLHTAEVTYFGSVANAPDSQPAGKVEVPGKVRHEGVVYDITGVSAKAFSGASKLTGIVLPAGVKTIGDFAFEGCLSLSSVVFPSNPVRMGDGVFFLCTNLKDVTFGDKWREVDLRMLRWSDSLRTVNIPASVERVMNLKSLKHLEKVTVEESNTRFSALDGLLYSKDCSVMYACPRAYSGKVKIAEGTKTILGGALVDCLQVTSVDFPSTLESMSFRELSRMQHLETVVLRQAKPITTAICAGKEVLLLQFASQDAEIIVLKSGRKAYLSKIATEEGEYTEVGSEILYMVRKDEIPSARRIVGVKDFAKYEATIKKTK